MNELFPQAEWHELLKFYETRQEWHDILNYRTIAGQTGPIDAVFYGDSITYGWALPEFFPGHRLLNRGIPGDSALGLHYRLEADVLAYAPRQVFLLIGINGIELESSLILGRIQSVATRLADAGSAVYLGSILPLRSPDNWNRFQYQGKIVELNAALQQWSSRHLAGFLDYHRILRDDTGQLAAEYARPDGTHITFAAYRRMSELVAPLLNSVR